MVFSSSVVRSYPVVMNVLEFKTVSAFQPLGFLTATKSTVSMDLSKSWLSTMIPSING